MKKKCLILIALLGLSVVSCNEIEEVNSCSQTVNDESQSSQARSMGGEYQVLGYGYDITEEYLGRKAIKLEVLNIDSFIQMNPNLYKVENVGEIEDQTYFGENYMNYVKTVVRKSNFSGSVAEKISKADTEKGEIPYSFSGSYGNEFTDKKTVTTKESYGRIDLIKHLAQYILYSDPSSLGGYLTSYFKNKLKTSSPEAIVEEFGTHVLLDFVVGGSLSTFYTSTITDITNYESKTDVVEAGAQIALKKMGISFKSNVSTTKIEEYQRKNSNWICNITVRGGQHNGHKVTVSSDGVYNHTFELSEWQKTVDKSNCVLTEINFNRTYPIYDFITDPVKKEQIKNAVVKYLESKKKPILTVKPMFQLKSKSTGDTWWVYSMDEVTAAVNRWGEEFQGLLGFVLAEPASNARPMYRLKSRRTSDTWYAFDYGTVQDAIAKWNEQYGGIDGYLYQNQQEDSRPLYRLKSRKTSDTWYTCDYGTVQYAISKWNENYGGIDGYVINP